MRKGIQLVLTSFMLVAVLLFGTITVFGANTLRGSASVTVYEDGYVPPSPTRPGGSSSGGGGTGGGTNIRDGDIDRSGTTGGTGTPDDTVSIFDTEVPLAALGTLPKTGSNLLAVQALLLVGIASLAACKRTICCLPETANSF